MNPGIRANTVYTSSVCAHIEGLLPGVACTDSYKNCTRFAPRPQRGIAKLQAEFAVYLCAALNMLYTCFLLQLQRPVSLLAPLRALQAASLARIIPWLRRQVHACSTLLAHTRDTAHCRHTGYKTLLLLPPTDGAKSP